MCIHQRCFAWIFAAIVSVLPPVMEVSCAQEGYGTLWTENHPDRILIEQLSQTGLHEIAIEVCQRRGGDSSLANSINERAHWRMLWMEALTNKLISESATWLDNPTLLTRALGEMDQACEKEQAEDRGLGCNFNPRAAVGSCCVPPFQLTWLAPRARLCPNGR